MSCNVVLYFFVYFCNMFDWMFDWYFLSFWYCMPEAPEEVDSLLVHAKTLQVSRQWSGDQCHSGVTMTAGELQEISHDFHDRCSWTLRRCLLCSIPFALTATCRRCATLSARRQQMLSMLSPYAFTPVTLTTYWYLLIRLFGFCLPFHSVFCWTTRFCLKVMDAALPEGEWMRFAACSVDGRMCSLTSQAETW